jgi:glucose-6-phosphate isomerase
LGELLFDYSKNIITDETLRLLQLLAIKCGLSFAIAAMFEGQPINETENRAVLHTALRDFSSDGILLDDNDILPDIRKVQAEMKAFCAKVHEGHWKGYTGKPIRNIVNIGIGGSDLGPVMVTEALKPYWREGIHAYFVSNVDGSHLAETLKLVNPEETLF